jgi:hypothetical protein
MVVTGWRVLVRGLLNMAIVAALFGYWQQNVWAGVFMMSFLLLLDKCFRFLYVAIVSAQQE